MKTPSAASPYPGLRAFRRSEAGIFFGREEQVDELLARLEGNRLLAVAGDSGCGKSSLIAAGLIPALKAGFMRNAGTRWRVAEMRPGNSPVWSLATALAPLFGDSSAPTPNDVGLLSAQLRRGPYSILELLQARPLPDGSELLIVVDQFEELIRFRNRIDHNEAETFIALLLETMRHLAAPVHTIITLRTDYLGKCALFQDLPEALSRSQYLTPLLTREQLMEAIINPARVFGGDVNVTLTNHLINEIGRNQDQLPVIQHALMTMWSRARSRHARQSVQSDPEFTNGPVELTLDDFEALGGLGQALDRHATTVYENLPNEDARRIADKLFCALWEDDAKVSDNRRPCTFGEVSAIVAAPENYMLSVVEAFRAAEHSFLLPRVDDSPKIEPGTVLDISHESLFRHWRLLQSWTKAEAENADVYRQLVRQGTAWSTGKGELLTHRSLDFYLEWQERVQPSNAWALRYGKAKGEYDLAQAFIEASLAARRNRERENKKQRRFVRGLMGITLVLVVGAVATAFFEWFHMRSEQERRQIALARQFLTSASQAILSEPFRSLQLSLEAASSGHNRTDAQSQTTLRSALRRSRLRAVLVSSGAPFSEARFLPDGQHLATVGEGDGLAVWDIHTGSRVRAMIGSETHLEHLVVDPDGHYAATAGQDGIIEIWELESGTRVHAIDEHFEPVNDLALSPDGSLLASASDDGSVRIWDMATGVQKQAIFDEVGAVSAVAFTHDGKSLATSGQEQRIVLWDLNTAARIRTIFRNDRSKLGPRIAFNSRGTLFAAARWNETLLWDPITGKLEGSLTHTNKVTSFAFSPSGLLLASVGYDGELKVWDVRKRVELYSITEEPGVRPLRSSLSQMLSADSGWLRQVEFSSDGQQLMTIGIDGTLKVWSGANGEEDTAFLAHEGGIRDVIFTADGRFIASSGDDGTAAVWDWQRKARVFHTPVNSNRVAPQIDFHLGTNTLAVAAVNVLSFWNADRHVRTRPDLPVAGKPIERISYFHRQNRIVVGAGDLASIFDLTKPAGTLPRVLPANTTIYAVAVSPDDQTVAFNCAANPKGEELAICLWDAESGAIKTKLADANAASLIKVLDLAFSADGNWLVAADVNKSVQVWDLRRRTLDRVLVGHRETVTGVAVSNEGNRIATTGDDWMRVWDRKRGSPVDGFPDAEPGGWRASFSPDNRHVAVGGVDGFIRVYTMDAPELAQIALARVPFALTNEDCLRYGSVPCTSKQTSLQLANTARVELRSGNNSSGLALMQQAHMIEPNAGFGQDLWRFDAYKFLTQGQAAIREPMRHALAVLPKNPGKDRERIRLKFQSDLSQALRTGMTAAMLSFDQVPSVDLSLQFDPRSFASSVATSELLEFARSTATRGRDGFALELLRLAPGKGINSDWTERAGGALVKSAVMRAALEDYEHKDWSKAVLRLASVDMATTDSRYDAYLRLKIRLNGQLRNLDNSTHERAMARRNTDTLLAVSKARRTVVQALSALRLALSLEPDNDDVRYELALLEYASGKTLDAAAHLKDVAPTAGAYEKALHLAGSLAHDYLHEPTQAFNLFRRSMSSKSDDWADFAECALAANRLNEARLSAQRVLDEYDLGAHQAYTALAMRFVVVSSLARGGDFAAADRELADLIALAETISENSEWNYSGSKDAIRLITRPALRLFESKLVNYVESAPHNDARRGEELRILLGKAAKEWTVSR